MAVELIDGQRTWSMTRDAEGHRTYKIKHRVRCLTSLAAGATPYYEDGPARALQCPGLPVPGAWWIVDNDLDLWAWCRADATVTPVLENEPNAFFDVEQVFSTKPPEREKQRCQDAQIEDPLLEPQKVSGSFVKFMEEATHDKDGKAIKTSSHEVIRGPQVEFDKNRPQVKIEQNVAVLGLATFGPMIDSVNDRKLWGLPKRCIKLSNVTWERRFYGRCYVYYTRTLEFDVNARLDPDNGAIVSGFDRDLLDEGTKVLQGHWDENTGQWVIEEINGAPADPANPAHFIRFKDRNGENARVILNGAGLPADSDQGINPGEIHVEKYPESNFLTLGIPLDF